VFYARTITCPVESSSIIQERITDLGAFPHDLDQLERHECVAILESIFESKAGRRSVAIVAAAPIAIRTPVEVASIAIEFPRSRPVVFLRSSAVVAAKTIAALIVAFIPLVAVAPITALAPAPHVPLIVRIVSTPHHSTSVVVGTINAAIEALRKRAVSEVAPGPLAESQSKPFDPYS
jgi:hypothetical protein